MKRLFVKNKFNFSAIITASVLLFCNGILHAAEQSKNTIRLATTTSVVNSGLMKILTTTFESKHSYKINLFVSGSGNALRRARTGKADITITHSPNAETKLFKEGYAKVIKPLMKNKFILVGPQTDPAGIRNVDSVTAALKNIAMKKVTFISRGDDSGTHKKELSIWQKTNIEPYGDWYIETGSGMGDTLRTAKLEQAYTFSDNGTWLALRKQLNLTILFQDDPLLDNPYSITIVSPKKYPNINVKGAEIFMGWLLSNEGQALIKSYKLDGQQLFFSND